jgi:hypothetical protein
MKKEKVLIKKCCYTIVVENYEDSNTIIRTNDGFNPLELLGILEDSKLDIYQQIRGKKKPTIIKRKVIE